jgi:hypothetical protein
LSYSRTIVCLANSRKYQGRCIAGLEVNGDGVGKWVRPVGSVGKGELYGERLYSDGKEPQLLDVMEIEFLREAPSGCHWEDQVVNTRHRWVRKERFNRWSLYLAVEDVKGCLWFEGGSTSHGRNDKIPAEAAAGLSSSLKLIQPNRLKIEVQMEEGGGLSKPRRAIRGSFSIGGFDYTLSVTDCSLEQELKDAPVGTTTRLTRPLLCLSVSEPFEKMNCCYKLIAGVLE